MDAHSEIKTDIQKSLRNALKQSVLVNPRTSGDFYSNRSKISSKYTRFANKDDYLKKYFIKYEQGEYFAAFQDGAFLQINYEFDVQSTKKVYLKKMNLCYLPKVESGILKNEYIRIDYDNSSSNSFFHSYAHVHIGFDNTIRIPLDDVLLFSEFLEIILYLFYPDDFEKMYSPNYKITNTIEKNNVGRYTKEKVLSKELESFLFLKKVHK